MPACGRVSGGVWRHDLMASKESENNDFDFVEVDPTGRYGRYKEVLGKGASKTVYRAFDQEDGIEVAWNQILVQDVVQTPEDMDRLYSEINLLKTLKHKNIMKLYHSWVDKKNNNVNFITEIFTSGTLRQFRERHKHVDIKAVKNWSRQILRGLLYLHSHDPPIIHRDLKCDNILINGNQGEVKIGDLGLATILRHAHSARSVIGTPEFMAPELYEEEYTELADIYSFGMCLLEMVTAEYPYSECSNAAQIFKKVTSGQKPEALKKIKDSRVCQLIEKCLAKASERLPARELLMDPFLQCEGNLEAVESVPHMGRVMGTADNMIDLELIVEEPREISATVQISYKLTETVSNLPNVFQDGFHSSAGDSNSVQTSDNRNNPNIFDPTLMSHSKEDRARSVDFRVKGDKSKDDTVFLRLRIADTEGKVRNIHFPFDVESDTAMCVASEMVAELDLTDQDVTKVADMIDAAILALIPEWKPGVAIDETCGDGDALLDYSNAFEDGYLSTLSALDPWTTVCSSELPEENSSTFLRGSTPEAVSSPILEDTVCGRFEEITYQCHRSNSSIDRAEQCGFSIDLPEIFQAEVGLQSTDGPSSPVLSCTASCCKGKAVTAPFKECFCRTDVRITSKIETVSSSNELLELERKDGCPNYTHKTLEGSISGNEGPIFYTGSIPLTLEGEQESECHKSQHFVFASPSFNFCWDLHSECDDESAIQELTELARKHERELKELQRKHEEALTEFKNRWQQRKSLNPSLSSINSIVNHLSESDHECKRGVPHCRCKDTDCLESCPANLQVQEDPCRLFRNTISSVSSTNTHLPEEFSFHELQELIPYDIIDVNDSVLSANCLPNLAQCTLRSTLKSAGCQSRDELGNTSLTEPLFSLPIGAGMDCKFSTLRAQSLVKSGQINLCSPIKSQTVEQMV